jgi:hypothetical protein
VGGNHSSCSNKGFSTHSCSLFHLSVLNFFY